jgi:endoribonuclease Dicer
MVGYVQSRGRARHKTSTFIVMVQEGQAESLKRYEALVELEPELKKHYHENAKRAPVVDEELEEGEIDEMIEPTDLDARERFVVPATGASLTYNTAIGLLNHLCSLIPRDRFTPAQVPLFEGDYECTLQLPSSLPLLEEGGEARGGLPRGEEAVQARSLRRVPASDQVQQ